MAGARRQVLGGLGYAPRTVAEIYRHLGQFRGDAAFGTWLHRMTVNVVLNARKTDGRHRSRFEDDEEGDGIDLLPVHNVLSRHYAGVQERVFARAQMSASGFFRLDEAVPEVAVGYLPRPGPDAPWRSNVYRVPFGPAETSLTILTPINSPPRRR